MSYTPTIPPEDPTAIPHYLTTELQALAQSLQQSQPYAYLQTLNVAPAKPREGLIAKADGTHWNPGSGAGVYCYIAGAWVFFGGGGGTGTVTHTSGALTAHAVIVGNGTADVKALAALGSSGNVLTSNGAGADPSFQAAAGGGITAGTGDVTFSGTGSVATTIALGVEHGWTATQYVAQATLTDASTITPNVSALTNNLYLLLTSAVGGSRTMALPTGLQPGMIVNLEAKQPSSGGPCLIAFATGWKWGLGGADPQPIASTVASASDFYSGTVQADGNIHAVMIGQSGPTGAGYLASSTTSLTPGLGSRALTTQFGLAYSVGARARATSISTGDYFEGLVTSYSLGVLTINADTFSGSTARTDWSINLAGNPGIQGIQGVAGPAGSGNGVNTVSTTTYTVLTSDASKLISFTSATGCAVTVPQATGSFASPFKFSVENVGAGTVTLTPTTSTVDGAASLSIATNQGCDWSSDSTNWRTQRGIGGGSSVKFASFTTNGSTATNSASTSFVNIASVTASLAASVNDRLLLQFSGSCFKTTTSAAALYRFFLNAANAVGALVLDYPTLGISQPTTLVAVRTVVAGDITAGVVPVTVQWMNNTAGTINLVNSANGVGVLTITNLGP